MDYTRVVHILRHPRHPTTIENMYISIPILSTYKSSAMIPYARARAIVAEHLLGRKKSITIRLDLST